MNISLKTTRIFILIAVVFVIGISFYGGWVLSKRHTHAAYIFNYKTVRNIVETGFLEVNGVAKIDMGNEPNKDDNSVLNFLKATSLARHMKLEIPFVARFGILFNDEKPFIVKGKNFIEVTLPEVKLLRYELHLEKMDAMSRKGLSLFEFQADYLDAERVLYNTNRRLLEKDITYTQQAQQRIKDLLIGYFSPSGKKVIVNFGSTSSKPTP